MKLGHSRNMTAGPNLMPSGSMSTKLTIAKAHAPRSAGAGLGRGVGVMAWGRHENWAADRGCHAATCSWKEIPRKRGCIHGRSSPNPPPAQVTKPAPRRIGRTQAHKLPIRGCGAHDRKSCHLQLRVCPVRHHAHRCRIGKISQAKLTLKDSPDSLQIYHRSSIHHEQRCSPIDEGILK